jgi:hypothetical protein
MGEGLREKFGAPPRSTPAPRASALPPAPRVLPSAPQVLAPSSEAPADTVADVRCAQARDAPTEVQIPIEFTADGSTPAPGYVPTLLLSSSSVPDLPAEVGARSDLTDRGLPPDEVRNRTTQTNPIGFVRAADAESDDSIEIDFRADSWLTFWRFAFVRRAAATLALGAIIGVPPAILGVLWTRHLGGLPTFSFGRDSTSPPASLPAKAGAPVVGTALGSSEIGTAGALAPPSPIAPRPVVAGETSSRSTAVEPLPIVPIAAESALVRVQRVRSKAPIGATASVLVQESEARRGDVKRAAPPTQPSAPKAEAPSIPPADPIPPTILPPSGL